MSTPPIPVFNAARTADLLDFSDIVREIKRASIELADGLIQAPTRQALDFAQGGNLLSMPAAAADLGIHKLVTVIPDNRQRNLPTIHGIVSAYDGQTGRPLFLLDGPTVTARRTAAVSMVGLDVFLPAAPTHVTIIGCGVQASGHAQALASLYPGLGVSIIARDRNKAFTFVDTHRHLDLTLTADDAVPDNTDAVITLTTSTSPIYDQPATVQRLIVAVGAFKPEMAEIGSTTLHGSQLYVDESVGARHEAGDYLQAEVDWNQVMGLADALRHGVSTSRPIVYKTVGCSAWDLAAARSVLRALGDSTTAQVVA